MKFHKTLERIIRFENFSGYLLIREFKYDDNTSNPIAEFMKTRYFSWKEEFRNEVNVTVGNSNELTNWNFHGLYDIKKMRLEHFMKVTGAEFVDCFMKTLQTEIGDDKKMTEAQEFINSLSGLNSDFYVIRNLSDELKHDRSVFDFFLSGFNISKSQMKLIAIECGLD